MQIVRVASPHGVAVLPSCSLSCAPLALLRAGDRRRVSECRHLHYAHGGKGYAVRFFRLANDGVWVHDFDARRPGVRALAVEDALESAKVRRLAEEEGWAVEGVDDGARVVALHVAGLWVRVHCSTGLLSVCQEGSTPSLRYVGLGDGLVGLLRELCGGAPLAGAKRARGAPEQRAVPKRLREDLGPVE